MSRRLGNGKRGFAAVVAKSRKVGFPESGSYTSQIQVTEKPVSRELTKRTYPSRDNTIDLYALGGWRKG